MANKNNSTAAATASAASNNSLSTVAMNSLNSLNINNTLDSTSLLKRSRDQFNNSNSINTEFGYNSQQDKNIVDYNNNNYNNSNNSMGESPLKKLRKMFGDLFV